MSKLNLLSLVPEADIPAVTDMPDELIHVYIAAMRMEHVCLTNAGIGLSAIQVGLPWDMFIVHRPSKHSYPTEFEYYVGCSYEGLGDKSKSIEGCLSLRRPDGATRRFEVDRFQSVRVKGKRLLLSQNGSEASLEEFESVEDGYYAVVFQHEIDHGKGVLISHIGTEVEVSDA